MTPGPDGLIEILQKLQSGILVHSILHLLLKDLLLLRFAFLFKRTDIQTQWALCQIAVTLPLYCTRRWWYNAIPYLILLIIVIQDRFGMPKKTEWVGT